jgi:hypothetical protein
MIDEADFGFAGLIVAVFWKDEVSRQGAKLAEVFRMFL